MAATSFSPRARRAGLLLLQSITAAVFLVAGIAKLSGSASMIAFFQAVGFGQWFRYAVGVAEVVGGVLLLLPRLAGLGALFLTVEMLGAMATQALVLHASPLAAAIMLIPLIAIVWLRWTDTREAVTWLRALGRGGTGADGERYRPW
ncbi:MAG TPA: DoxX family protein [Gemmatimonadaceae bacterium]|nr:DoxX family protein [Gemmatimonadaceae bacterium]